MHNNQIYLRDAHRIITMAQKLFVFLNLIIVFIISKINCLTLKMIPINSPDLQIIPQHMTVHERNQFLVNIAMSRVNNYSLNFSRLSPNGLKSPLTFARSSFYVTQLAFGSGDARISPFLALDTGSHETWVQCEGCNPCVEFKGKNFSYRASPTYSRMSVDDPMCSSRQAYMGSCRYDIRFVMGSRVAGFVGRDNFYIQDGKTGRANLYQGLAFGCGLENTVQLGRNIGPDNVIAGIHGLAPGPRSFLTQLSDQIKGRFSYCLVPWSRTQVMSNMYLGDDAQISGDATRQVQTLRMHRGNNYHLYLSGISVNGIRLRIDPSIFQLDSRHNKGFFIDSGSPYTSLPHSIFNPLKDAVVQYFANNYGWHPWQPIHGKPGYFDLCYLIDPSGDQDFPVVIFHFEGVGQGEVNWAMHKFNTFQRLPNNVGVGFCMAILTTDYQALSLFGAYQQVNFNILYDIHNGLLSFVPQMCR